MRAARALRAVAHDIRRTPDAPTAKINTCVEYLRNPDLRSGIDRDDIA
jgi:hypothetical protein